MKSTIFAYILLSIIFYQSQANTCTPEKCPPGKFENSGGCTDCILNCKKCSDASKCDTCFTGFKFSDASTKTACVTDDTKCPVG